MLRTVVTFLVAVPLLMPPGMCICQFAPTARASTPTRSGGGAGHTADARPDCRCDSCRERAAPAGLPCRGEEDQPSPDEGPFAPGKHAPGCPAALGDVPTKMAASTVTIHLDANPVCFFSVVARPAGPAGRGRESATARAASPPLFISHCSLQI